MRMTQIYNQKTIEIRLPVKDGLVDWDCPEAISIPDMEKALSHIRSTGTFPVSLLALDSPTLSHRHEHGIQQQPILWAAAAAGPATDASFSCHGPPPPSFVPRTLSLTGGRRGAAAGIGGGPSSSSFYKPLSTIASSHIGSPLSTLSTSISLCASSPSSSRFPVPSPAPLQHESPVPQTRRDQEGSSLTNPNPPASGFLLPRKQPEVDSKEDQNSVGECPIPPAQIASAKQRVNEWLQPGQIGSRIFPPKPVSPKGEGETHHHRPSQNGHHEQDRAGPRICLLDGFLLYSPTHLPEEIMTSLLDIKLFLLVSRQKATQRREARDGYVTLEGFWTDPPGYVDKIVWPNYVEAHRWLFKDGDVERGELDQEAMRKYGVLAQTDKGLDVPFSETLDWAVETIMRELERIVLGEDQGAGAGRG